MQRNEWKFPYTIASVHEAAITKADYHKERLTYWETTLDQTKALIKSEGLEFDESLANLVSNSYSRAPTVNVRNDLLKDLQECTQKIHEHRAKKNEYDGWVEILSKQPSTSELELKHDDWLFFFGVK